MKTFLITSLLLVACDRCSKKEEDSAAKDSSVESKKDTGVSLPEVPEE